MKTIILIIGLFCISAHAQSTRDFFISVSCRNEMGWKTWKVDLVDFNNGKMILSISKWGGGSIIVAEVDPTMCGLSASNYRGASGH